MMIPPEAWLARRCAVALLLAARSCISHTRTVANPDLSRDPESHPGNEANLKLKETFPKAHPPLIADSSESLLS
jgi:hypothetical protein